MAQGDPDDNVAWRIWIGTITTLVPASVAVVLRYIARYISQAGFWWDDYTIAIALIVNWGMAATRWSQVLLYDYGRHAEFLPIEEVRNFQKSFLAIQITYFSNAVFTKTSLLFLYYRIFGVVKRFRWVLYISGFVVIAYFVACVIVSIAGCHPVSWFWDQNQPGGCIDLVNFFRWNGIANMLLDVLVLCLPFPMTWRLNTTVRQKLILSGIFLLGGFVCIVSILRIVAFNKADWQDPTYTTIDTAMWSSIEQSVGIVCACLPTLSPLFRCLYGGSRGGTRKSSDDQSHSQFRFRPSSIHLSHLGSRTDDEGGSMVSPEGTRSHLSMHESPIHSGHKGNP